MATDLAVQAARLVHELSARHFEVCIKACQGPTVAEMKTAALIRAQAFTEAADALPEPSHDDAPVEYGQFEAVAWCRGFEAARDRILANLDAPALRLVRGLGEETENA